MAKNIKSAEVDARLTIFGLDLLGLMVNFVKGLFFFGASWKGNPAFGLTVKHKIEKE